MECFKALELFCGVSGLAELFRVYRSAELTDSVYPLSANDGT